MTPHRIQLGLSGEHKHASGPVPPMRVTRASVWTQFEGPTTSTRKVSALQQGPSQSQPWCRHRNRKASSRAPAGIVPMEI